MPAIAADIGLATLHSRVERWECDYNNHWNVRFYCRSFQMADEVAAAKGGVEATGTPPARHIRFHSELFDASPVEVRSMVLDAGPHQGTTVQVLSSEGRVSASAMDFGGAPRPGLPGISPDLVDFALPRGLEAGGSGDRAMTTPSRHNVRLGLTRPSEFDHNGRLLDEELMRRISVISHFYLTAHGFGHQFTQSTGLNRMSVEMKLIRHRECRPGDALIADARLIHANAKNFVIRHNVFDTQGCLASVEQCLVMVDLGTRKMVPVPYDLLNLVPA